MASRQTWERRILAGVLAQMDECRLRLIEGLQVDETTGVFEFSHERLTETEAQRIQDVYGSVRSRLSGRYERLGGSRADDSDDDEGDDSDDDEGSGETSVSTEAVS